MKRKNCELWRAKAVPIDPSETCKINRIGMRISHFPVVAAGLVSQRQVWCRNGAFGSRNGGFGSRNGCFGSRNDCFQTDSASIFYTVEYLIQPNSG